MVGGMTADEVGELDPSSVKPLDVDGVSASIAGTVGFAIGLVVLLFLRSQLEAANNSWWIWVCVAGLVLGLAGTAYTTRRRAAYRAAGHQTY